MDTGEYDADADYDDEEFEDFDDENQDGDENESGTNTDEEIPPAVAKRLEALLEEREKRFTESYKGLQRNISAKDREILDLRKALDERGQDIEDASEAFKWVAETVLSALPDDVRKSAELALRERTANLATKRLESARQKPAQKQESEGDDVMPDWVKERIQKFVGVARKSAQRAGVDPDDKSLDYGSDDEGLVERLERFEESLAKAVEAKKDGRKERVRQKQEPVATRSSGGGSSPAASVSVMDDPLRAGSAKRLADMRSGKYG